MNKEFIKKIIKAEALRYSAIKEILPDGLKKKIDDFEKDALNVLKDIAFESLDEKSELKECKKVHIN
ncbi:hypothetical protein AGR56_00080 [Clostridium sp. DMHC 10]|uniref:hypothetical protein n=1 Tax=Clostridium sp. DMHC 10 TaxID=747377 RepID=UPI00069CC480|nr:hypothetical protein [Clostridium sp. DMHC 10]KOF58264.1 hypothetical protein AGR56_00080 [Clostridium sp. DMHC 10]